MVREPFAPAAAEKTSAGEHPTAPHRPRACCRRRGGCACKALSGMRGASRRIMRAVDNGEAWIFKTRMTMRSRGEFYPPETVYLLRNRVPSAWRPFLLHFICELARNHWPDPAARVFSSSGQLSNLESLCGSFLAMRKRAVSFGEKCARTH